MAKCREFLKQNYNKPYGRLICNLKKVDPIIIISGESTDASESLDEKTAYWAIAEGTFVAFVQPTRFEIMRMSGKFLMLFWRTV